MKKPSQEIIHEGKYAAEIPIELVEDETAWSPYVSMDDALKIEAARNALRAGDVATAAKYGQVFELRAIAG